MRTHGTVKYPKHSLFDKISEEEIRNVISSEGVLIAIVPYDYTAAQRSHFLRTHRSLITTLSINVMMTLVTKMTMITMMTKIT